MTAKQTISGSRTNRNDSLYPAYPAAQLRKRALSSNEAMLLMRQEGVAHRQRRTPLLVDKINLRQDNGQVSEVIAYVSAINRLNTLSSP
ncbi:hypothetical protein [Aeromonas finlandensis]|uniref:hypothetical protein n=1 Tax=Aeromonas finlandensis TaxID=1543375 RepID=UPI0012E0AFB7